MAQKPSIPKGTRDFSPIEMVRRNFIFDTIKKVFQNYGYQPIETPAMENLSTLMGKSGEEGDRLLFKILNSGDFIKGVSQEDVDNKNLAKLTTSLSEKGLRYDLTVPFARFVVQHRNEISFPFKRYQIQPVWRADRPQKGRYREFYQCDVDVIGSDSLLNEVELVKMIDDIFNKLGIQVVVKLSNRKILSGIAELVDERDKLTDITTAIDKLDKIGLEKVVQELLNRGISLEKIDQILPIIQLTGSNIEKLGKLENMLGNTDIGSKGIAEMKTLLTYTGKLHFKSEIDFDPSLARGLDYYTGTIFEVVAKEIKFGSICGGGRYDNLTGVFGLPDVSGVGVSFGAERIYDVMAELNLFPEEIQHSTEVMLVNFGDKEAGYSLTVLEKLQEAGIRAELYPDVAKMKKQLGYADKKSVKYVLLIGEREMESGKYTLKNMLSGEQQTEGLPELIKRIKS